MVDHVYYRVTGDDLLAMCRAHEQAIKDATAANWRFAEEMGATGFRATSSRNDGPAGISTLIFDGEKAPDGWRKHPKLSTGQPGKIDCIPSMKTAAGKAAAKRLKTHNASISRGTFWADFLTKIGRVNSEDGRPLTMLFADSRIAWPTMTAVTLPKEAFFVGIPIKRGEVWLPTCDGLEETTHTALNLAIAMHNAEVEKEGR